MVYRLSPENVRPPRGGPSGALAMFLVLAFAVVIVGGMGSIVGAVVAALLLSQLQGLASLWIPPVWAETLVYGVMLLVLIVRPGGLFNRLGEA